MKTPLPSRFGLLLAASYVLAFGFGDAQGQRIGVPFGIDSHLQKVMLRPEHGRELQVAGEDVILRNFVVHSEVLSFDDTSVQIELIADFLVQSSQLSRLVFAVFNTRFGNVDAGKIQVFLNQRSLRSTNDFDSGTLFNDPSTVAVQLNNLAFFSGDIFTTRYIFTVTETSGIGPLCLSRSNGLEGLAATWIHAILSTSYVPENVEIDYTIPLDSALELLDPELIFNDLELALTPASSFDKTLLVNNDTLTIYQAYNSETLELNDGESTLEIMLTWQSGLANVDLKECQSISTSFSTLGFVIIVIAIPAAACICLFGMACVQRIMVYCFGMPEPTNSFQRRIGLNFFPGNRDLVLTPGGANNETTVTAVRESQDAPELDNLMGINTIEVNVNQMQLSDSNQLLSSSPTAGPRSSSNDPSL